MNITRKAFCTSLAGATVTLWLQGCGGGGDSSSGGGTGSGAVACGANGNDITANHGHELMIMKADLDSMSAMSYSLTPGVDGHMHTLTFSADQLAALKAGSAVTVTSSVTNASGLYGGVHSHNVTAHVNVATCP